MIDYLIPSLRSLRPLWLSRFDSLEIKMAKPKAKEEEQERSWQEIADAMESDGTEFGIRLNFNKDKDEIK